MRNGAFTFYRIQHKDSHDAWQDSALGHFFFGEFLRRTARLISSQENEIRNLLRKENDLWQVLGEHGFASFSDVLAVYDLIRKVHPGRRFKIIRVHQTKTTEDVIG